MKETLAEMYTARFGVFAADLRASELRRGGNRVRIQQKPFQILAILLEYRGELVTHGELRSRVWPSGVHVDFDQSLKTAVNKLRKALGDSAATPRYVETVPRRGYRFLRPVLLVPQCERPKITEKIKLAVMPFENMNSRDEDHGFSVGITIDVIAQLGISSHRRIGVTSRRSIVNYRGSQKSIEEIGKELSVHYILEGYIRKIAKRVRITAHLIQVSDQTQLWAASYDYRLGNLLSVQRNAARTIVAGVKAKLEDPSTAGSSGTTGQRAEFPIENLENIPNQRYSVH